MINLQIYLYYYYYFICICIHANVSFYAHYALLFMVLMLNRAFTVYDSSFKIDPSQQKESIS